MKSSSMQWKVEVRVGDDPRWHANVYRYETQREAEAAARELWRLRTPSGIWAARAVKV
jgi:hypothetical protein